MRDVQWEWGMGWDGGRFVGWRMWGDKRWGERLRSEGWVEGAKAGGVFWWVGAVGRGWRLGG